MPVDWKSAENNERLLACLCLSIDEGGGKVNYKRIAELFGQGTTANAIECNFRKIRAAAKEVKKELEGGITQSTPSATSRKPRTPKKDSLSGVKSGRVEKPDILSKKYSAAVIAQEIPDTPFEVGYVASNGFYGAYDAQLSCVSADCDYDGEV